MSGSGVNEPQRPHAVAGVVLYVSSVEDVGMILVEDGTAVICAMREWFYGFVGGVENNEIDMPNGQLRRMKINNRTKDEQKFESF